MLKKRVIPCLLLSGDDLVKTTKFKSPIYVGDPINTIKIFNDKEVDELIILDISSSKQNKEINFRLIEDIASECFMPICYGGGIRNVSDAERLFSIGVEKISLQSSLILNPNLFSEIASKFGSQSVVVSIDIKKDLFRRYRPYYTSVKKFNKLDIRYLIEYYEKLGAGELLINFVDNDGLLCGIQTDLIDLISSMTTVPVIFGGGINSLKDIKCAMAAGADAVFAGAFFVFNGPYRAVLISYPRYEDMENILNEK